MSKLVRARVKAVEQMPEWDRCCQLGIDTRLACPEMLVDLNSVQEFNELKCTFCGYKCPPGTKAVIDTIDGLRVPLESIDLDEGPLEESA